MQEVLTRLAQAVRDAKYKDVTTPHPPRTQTPDASSSADHHHDERSAPVTTPKSPISPARERWKMVTEIARRAGADDTSPSVSDFSSSSSSEDESSGPVPKKRPSRQERDAAAKKRGEATAQRKKTAKMMDLQYFLEMVDHKHRYGSNLRKYHNYWKTQDTSQNFFYWLDQGEGKDVEVPECSRVRLNREQVRYLSREERLQYLVRINEEGLFEWVKNGERVWTKDELYKDSVKGIVPVTDPTPKFEYNVPPPDGRGRYSESESDSDSDSDSDSSPENEDAKIDNTAGDEGERYVNEDVSSVCR